jgi:hypothetical protein
MAAVIVTVGTKFAVSSSPATAVKVQGLVAAVQVPPAEPVNWLPAVGLAASVMLSPTSTRQLVAFLQWTPALASLTVAVPLPVVAAVIVTVWTKFAVSVSLAAAVKVHGLVAAVQVPPDHLASWLPLAGVAVIVIESPAPTEQCAALVQ